MISVVTIIPHSTQSQQLCQNAVNNFTRQTYEKKELLVILKQENPQLENQITQSLLYQSEPQSRSQSQPNTTNFNIYRLANHSLAEIYNYTVDNFKGDYWTIMHPEDYYTPNYLAHSLSYFKKKF